MKEIYSVENDYDGPRVCKEYELGEVVELANYVMQEMYGRYQWSGRGYAFMYSRRNRDNVRIIRVKNRVVSSIAIYVSRVKCASYELTVGG